MEKLHEALPLDEGFSRDDIVAYLAEYWGVDDETVLNNVHGLRDFSGTAMFKKSASYLNPELPVAIVGYNNGEPALSAMVPATLH